MRQTNLTKTLFTTKVEIEDKLLGAKKNFRNIQKSAKDLYVAQIISLDQAHVRVLRNNEIWGKL